MNFILDMHISVQVAERLRIHGHDGFQLRERALERLADADILALAKLERRVIVSFDLDFSALLARSRDASPSVIQLRTGDARANEVSRLLLAVIAVHQSALDEGCILTVEPDRIRMRRLPLF